jgi:putative SOS response-associated peptidase YedK
LLSRRCAVPAERFWEWDFAKNRVEFTDPARSMMFLAGFWQLAEGIRRFVVMTTAANASVSRIHDRMPLMIDRSSLRRWILDDGAFQQLMTQEMPPLSPFREEEQLSLFGQDGIGGME